MFAQGKDGKVYEVSKPSGLLGEKVKPKENFGGHKLGLIAVGVLGVVAGAAAVYVYTKGSSALYARQSPYHLDMAPLPDAVRRMPGDARGISPRLVPV